MLTCGSVNEAKQRIRNELEASALDEFSRIDVNHDGVVTKAEYQAYHRRVSKPSHELSQSLIGSYQRLEA